ncbi:MAG: ABC transporter ATP-binding protein/permease [Eubacteriales bacterium]|nr:ABC transporter ATP-binding protein/permease [Eubacteriales bacterium]
MIKKRLIGLMADSKKYIFYNVGWQWLGLVLSVITMSAAGALFEAAYRELWRGEKGALDGRLLSSFALVILAAVWGRAVCTRRAARASYLAGSQVKTTLRRALYEKLASFGPSYHEQVPTAEAVQVAAEGVEQLEVYFSRYLPQLFYSLLAPLTLFAVLSRISVKAGAALLVCVPLIPLTIMAVQKLAKRLLNKYWSIYTGLGDSFLENLQGLTALKIYEADELKAQEMDEESERFRKITMKVLMMQLNSIIVMDVVAYGGAAVGMAVVLREYLSGLVSLGGAMTVILLSADFFLPMRLLGSFFHIAMNGMAASDKLFRILDLPDPDRGTEELPEGPLGIVLDGVTYSYDGERTVLDGVSLTVPERGLTSVVGLSGCGKSTAAGIVTGRNKGYGGSVRIGRGTAENACGAGVWKELARVSQASLMKHVTLVSHNSYIFKGTVEDNLRMAAPEASEQQLWEVLSQVNLADFLCGPGQNGLKTELLERGANLSGGQCQRLALARALLHDTPVYVMDEATSNIDVESESIIMETVRRMAEEKAVLLISHRLANVVDSDCIYVLSGGRVAEYGLHEELMARGGIYEELYRTQRELEEYAGSAEGRSRHAS